MPDNVYYETKAAAAVSIVGETDAPGARLNRFHVVRLTSFNIILVSEHETEDAAIKHASGLASNNGFTYTVIEKIAKVSVKPATVSVTRFI